MYISLALHRGSQIGEHVPNSASVTLLDVYTSWIYYVELNCVYINRISHNLRDSEFVFFPDKVN